jgi:hypothetical protein
VLQLAVAQQACGTRSAHRLTRTMPVCHRRRAPAHAAACRAVRTAATLAEAPQATRERAELQARLDAELQARLAAQMAGLGMKDESGDALRSTPKQRCVAWPQRVLRLVSSD